MKKENKNEYKFNLTFWTGILLVTLFLGGSLFFLTNQLNTRSGTINVSEFPKETRDKINQPKSGDIVQSPADDLPSEDEVNVETMDSAETLLIPNPKVDNLIPEPFTTEQDPQLVALKRALRIQNEIYFLMSRNFLNETDPNMKAQIEKDLNVVQQKIDELQKAIDKLEKK